MSTVRPVGSITRGTTHPNRLRRCDRWLVATHGARLRRAPEPPIVVDLGYGASPVTVLELHHRLRTVRADVRVIGIEIDPDRVAAGQALGIPEVEFRLGGFEVPLAGHRASLIRAFNVLRQYDEAQVPDAWAQMCRRLSDDGLLIEGTCNEIGRVATWVSLDRTGPVSLTFALHLPSLNDPAVLAERLPKALIHRNVPGEPVHDFLAALNRAWARSSAHAAYGTRQRFIATARALSADWPLLNDERRWRLGELSLPWSAVAPRQ